MSAWRYRLLDDALRRGSLPDPVLRAGSRLVAAARERREARGGVEAQERRLQALLERMRTGPIAEQPPVADEQPYEPPAEFFELVLGPRRKYSACLWEPGVATLAEAEEAMLALTCERAGVSDGSRILDLGCGWGSLTLWLAEEYPEAAITAVSSSSTQAEYIEALCEEIGFANVRVLSGDVNSLEPPGRFDTVLCVETFEHMRNWRELLRRISTWLTTGGKLFVQAFCHRSTPYLREGTWAAERFPTAELMPSHELISFFQEDLVLEQRWAIPGTHYAKTLRAWREQLDAHRDLVLEVFLASGCSDEEAHLRFGQWRLFLLSGAESFGWRRGSHWLVGQYLLSRRGAGPRTAEIRVT